MLQWGRVLMNAETTQMDCATASAAWLQWGRVLMNAETENGLRYSLTEHIMLQWGRVLMNAETKTLKS